MLFLSSFRQEAHLPKKALPPDSKHPAGFRPLLSVILVKHAQPLVEHRVVVRPDGRGADAQSLLETSGRRKHDGADTVVKQQAKQFSPLYILVSHCKEETIAQRLVEVAVINDVESVPLEYLLHLLRAPAVLFHLFHEIEFAVVGCLEHGGQSVLRSMRRTRREAVEDAL